LKRRSWWDPAAGVALGGLRLPGESEICITCWLASRRRGECTRSLPPNITGRRILLQTSCNLRAVFPILSTSYGYMQPTEIHRLSVGFPPSDSSSSSFQAVGETLRGPSNPSAMGGRSCLPGLALIRSTACRHSLNVSFDVEMTLSCLDRGSIEQLPVEERASCLTPISATSGRRNDQSIWRLKRTCNVTSLLCFYSLLVFPVRSSPCGTGCPKCKPRCSTVMFSCPTQDHETAETYFRVQSFLSSGWQVKVFRKIISRTKVVKVMAIFTDSTNGEVRPDGNVSKLTSSFVLISTHITWTLECKCFVPS
jgi:hypothetical protein